jgi:hypothetical protein
LQRLELLIELSYTGQGRALNTGNINLPANVIGNFMKRHTNILKIALLLGLFSCNSSGDRQAKNIEKSAYFDSDSLTNTDTTETLFKREKDSDCIRGKAEPVILKEEYPNTTFILQPDSLSAIETVTFDNGDKLIIRNWGCEYYVLTFRFETTKFQQDITNLEYWFKAAKTLMTNMLSGLDEPFHFKRGLVFLDSYILRDQKNKFKNLKLGDEIEYNESKIRSYVTVDKIEKLTDKKYAVTISFATGPL